MQLKNSAWPEDERVIRMFDFDKEKPAGKGGLITRLVGWIVSLWKRLSSPKWRQ